MSASMFSRTSMLRTGYNRSQVDDFMVKVREAYERTQMDPQGLLPMDIRRAAFDEARGGYDTVEVDAALDTLEKAFSQRLRQQFIDEHGEEAWNLELQSRAGLLYERLTQPEGERFDQPAGMGRGYNAEQVDALVDRVAQYFNTGEPITVQEIRETTFARAARSRAYAESDVDTFLAKVIDLLLGIDQA